MAKRFYDTGLPDQIWYQRLSPKCKALYLHLLCKCDVAGTFEINYPIFSAYVGDEITEDDLFGSFGNRVVPLTKSENKGILADFVYFQCGGELNCNVKAHQSILKRLAELNITLSDLKHICTHELKFYTGPSKNNGGAQTEEEEQKNEEKEENPSEVESSVKNKRVKSSRNDSDIIVKMFDEFYAAYPRHDSKQVAMLKFAKLMNEQKTEEDKRSLLDKMLASIDKSKTSEQWLKDNGKYIPMPSTWLNQRRWEDEGLVSAPTEGERKTSLFAKSLKQALMI